MSEPLYRIWDIEALTFIPQDNYKWYVGMEGFVRNRDGFVSQAHFIIQRCTGETDVNGKYIYEGDIIQYGSMFCGYDKAVIEFDKGQFKLNSIKKSQLENILSTYITVVGNSLENPELLLERDEK